MTQPISGSITYNSNIVMKSYLAKASFNDDQHALSGI